MSWKVRDRFVLRMLVWALLLGVVMPAGALQEQTPGRLPLSDNVDLARFMGKWYVIANIPTAFERDSYAATEEYRWVGDGRVATTFSYRKGGLDGEIKRMRPTAFVSGGHAAIWKMQFVWPFRADYRIMYVDDAHQVTIVGREKRDFVWLMARVPELDEPTLQACIERIKQAGYDISKLRMMPHVNTTEPLE